MAVSFAQIVMEDDLTDFMSTQFGYTNADFIEKLRWWGEYYSIDYTDNIPRCKSAMETGAQTPEMLYFTYNQDFIIDAGP